MVQAHHERNQPLTIRITVHPELVEGLNQRSPNVIYLMHILFPQSPMLFNVRIKALPIGLFFGLWCLLNSPFTFCQAAEPSIEPILRVETDMHTAFIKKLSVDRLNHRVVSVSDDKTARVWDLKTGRLLNTLRVPIAPLGHEGQLQVGAVSPDGRTVVVGGNTGLGWSNKDQNSTLYFFELDTGLMKAVPLPKIPMVVENLAYSDDNRFLAVCLSTSKKSALLIYDMEKKEFIKITDKVYKDRIYGIDFSPDGRLAVTSVDGYVRLYNNAFDLLQEKNLGDRPFHAYFSPDGSEIAIGFDAKARVEILSGFDLTGKFSPDIKSLTNQKNLIAVEWSPTGDIVYAGGEYSGSGDTPIYFWGNKGRGKREQFSSHSNYRVSDLHTLENGSVIFSTGEPSIGLTDTQGKPIWLRNSDTVNFQASSGSFCVSQDGTQIEYPLQIGGKQVVRFSPLDGLIQASGDACSLTPPIQATPNIHLESWKDSEHPILNGKALEGMDNHESSQSYAISSDETQVLLGTSWALRLYDKGGKLKWKQPLSQMVWAVNISGNGRFALAALSDGTIRWYRMADGQEIFSYFPFNGAKKKGFEKISEQQWIAWTPYGYYASSERGDNYVGWHFNQGKDKSAEFLKAVQFERLLYKPQAVAEYFSCITAQDTKFKCPSSTTSANYKQLTDNKPPTISNLLVEAGGLSVNHTQASLKFSAEKTDLPIQDYTVFVNNIPITPAVERHLTDNEVDTFSRAIPLDFYSKENIIRVEVSNGKSVGVQERFYRTPEGQKLMEQPKGKLYLLAIGVNSFPKLDKSWQLHYAALDADAIGNTFREISKYSFEEIKVKILSDTQALKPEKAQILESLKFIQSAQANDTVIVYLSSHGISDPQQNYYFIPQDADMDDVRQIEEGQSENASSVISWETFFEALRGTAGKRLLIVDTCKAKSIEGKFDALWLKKHSASSHFAFMVSSKGTEKSLEDSKLGHGLFTYALLTGLTSGCNGNCKDQVTLDKLYKFTVPLIEKLRKNELIQQTPQLSTPDELRNMAIIGQIDSTGIDKIIEEWTSFLSELWRKFLQYMKLEWL